MTQPRIETPTPSAPTGDRSTPAAATTITPALYDSPFMRACRREAVPYTPVWLMRQAGRYMGEYREVRARTSFLELCKSPDLAAEVTVTAAERLNVDAAIIFADILLILEPMGLDLEFSKGEGPVIHNPVRTAQDVAHPRRRCGAERGPARTRSQSPAHETTRAGQSAGARRARRRA